MSNLIQDKLEILAQDEVLLNAIKTVFLAGIDESKPAVNSKNDDLELGQQYRAYETAKRIIDESFVKLKSYKPIPVTNKEFKKER